MQLSAAMFICETVAANPGRVTLLALASLTNVAMAMQHDPTVAGNLVRARRCYPRRVSVASPHADFGLAAFIWDLLCCDFNCATTAETSSTC